MRRISVIALALVFLGTLIGCSGHTGNSQNSKMGYQLINLTGAPLRVILSSAFVFDAGLGRDVPKGWRTEITLAPDGEHWWYPPCDPVYVWFPDLHPGTWWDISTTEPLCNPDEPPFDHFVYTTYDGDTTIETFSIPQVAPGALLHRAAKPAPRKVGHLPGAGTPAHPAGDG